MCTDKDHYHQGDTVTIYGNAGTQISSVDIKLYGTPFDETTGSYILTKPFSTDIGTVKVNDDGTFTTSFILQGNYYGGSGTYEVSVEYQTSTAADGVMPVGDSTFTAGDIVGNLNPFQIVLNQTSSGQQTFAIMVPDNQKYSVAVGNGGQVITRLTNPEGQITYINNPPAVPNFTPILGSYGNLNGMYGTWTVETTWGDNISLVNIDVPRPQPTVLVFLDKPSYVKTEKIRLLVSVIDKTPNETGFTYQIMDPSADIILSNSSSLVSEINPNNNSYGVPTVSNYIFIPTDSFPNVDGNYTVKVNYQGIEKTTSFQFVHYSQAFEEQQQQNQIQYILDSFTSAMGKMSPDITRQYLGNNTYYQYVNVTTGQPKNIDLATTMNFTKQGYKAFIWYSDMLKSQAITQIQGLDINDSEKKNAISEINSTQENYIYSGISTYNQMVQNLNTARQMAGGNSSIPQMNQIDEQELRQEISSDLASKGSENQQLIQPQPATSPITSTTNITTPIPAWVKNNAKWWSQGQLGDSDFEKGIEYLIDQKIINIPPQSQTTSGAQQIPVWVKNTAGMWASGKISDNDFLSGIEYLVQIGIIKI